MFLDYRTDPADFRFEALNAETREYLTKSAAVADSPLKRLELLNAPAIELYRQHGIDLAAEALEIAVCAQHNNGGLAANIWWESENIKGLFPVGEVNGSHGVTRPGGTALNAGQVGAFRAAEFIAAMRQYEPVCIEDAAWLANSQLEVFRKRMLVPAKLNWREERRKFQTRMSESAAFVRERRMLAKALAETREQLALLNADGLGGLDSRALAETLRNGQLLTAQVLYLETMRKQVGDGVGSRGSSIVIAERGEYIHPSLPPYWQIEKEDASFRGKVLTARLNAAGEAEMAWEPCRGLPVTDGWFENVWRACREKKIYGEA